MNIFLIPDSNLIIVDVLYGYQTSQMERDLTHFFPYVQTGGLSHTILLTFLTSKIDSLICHCCWLERAQRKWSNSTIDFNLDIWHARSHLTCQNVNSYYHISSHGPTSREIWGHIMATNPEELIWIFSHLMILSVSTKFMSQTFYISSLRLFQFCGLPILSMWRGGEMGKGEGHKIGITLFHWY